MKYLILADLADIATLAQEYGPFYGVLIAAVCFFIWRDWKREERLTRRISTLEDETKNVLLPLVKECTVVVAKNTQVMERLERHLN